MSTSIWHRVSFCWSAVLLAIARPLLIGIRRRLWIGTEHRTTKLRNNFRDGRKRLCVCAFLFFVFFCSVESTTGVSFVGWRWYGAYLAFISVFFPLFMINRLLCAGVCVCVFLRTMKDRHTTTFIQFFFYFWERKNIEENAILYVGKKHTKYDKRTNIAIRIEFCWRNGISLGR